MPPVMSSRRVGQALPPANRLIDSDRPHRRDAGFAMLLVFLMAAVVAIMLYMEIPRIAFETQRQKEQMLIERGQQYKRAIQLFLRANNNTRWPASLDDLESFNGRRFLRRRYKDPMTGKEWRLVHIQNGVLTDSVNNKPNSKPGDQKDGKDALEGQTVSNYGNSVGSYDASQGPGAVNAAQRRRTSDSGMPGSSPFPGTGGPGSGTNTTPDGTQTAGLTNSGQTGTGQPGMPPGIPGIPGLPGQLTSGSGAPNSPFPGQYPRQISAGGQNASQSSGSTVGDYSSFGGSNTATSQPGSTTGTGALSGQSGMGMPGPVANSQNFGGTPAYSAAGAQGYPQPGMSMNMQQSGAATNLINNLLTSPRPGGLAGIAGQGTVIGGGIAGVASTVDAESIMVYNNHTNYTEWEFIFDPSKQHYPPPNPLAGSVGTAASQLGSMQGSTPGTPASQIGTMPGSTTGVTGNPGGTQNSPFGTMSGDPDLRPGHE